MRVPLREEFLNQFSKKSKQTYRVRFKSFLEFLDDIGIDRIDAVEKRHVEQWAREIVEPMRVRKETKHRYWALIRSYFTFLYENHQLSVNLGLSVHFNGFTDFIRREIVDRQSANIPEVFEVVQLIRHAKQVNPRMYIYLVLMAFNGARDSEIRTVKLADIFDMSGEIRKKSGNETVKYTYFQSGTTETAMKKGQVFYFVPKQLRYSLEWKIQIEQVKKFKHPVYLFQTQDRPHPISYRSTYRNVQKYGTKIGLPQLRWTTHIFRDILNEERMAMKCEPSLRAILLNQAPKGTNAAFYTKKCRQMQRRYKYWIEYTPEELLEVFL